jgi:hypothetical protein
MDIDCGEAWDFVDEDGKPYKLPIVPTITPGDHVIAAPSREVRQRTSYPSRHRRVTRRSSRCKVPGTYGRILGV